MGPMAEPTASGRSAAAVTETQVADLSTDRRVAWLLQRLDLARRARELTGELGTAQMRLLWLFVDQTPRTLREIAVELGLEQSTVNRQVNAALQAGLLRRFREPGRAARLVAVTPKGLECFETDLDRILGAYGRALQSLGEPQTAQFLLSLAQFVDAYEAIVAEESHPPGEG